MNTIKTRVCRLLVHLTACCCICCVISCELSADTLSKDGRLTTLVHINTPLDGSTIGSLLKRLTANSAVSLKASPKVKSRLVFILATHLSLYKVMTALSWTTRLTWSPQGTGYLLHRTLNEKKMEKSEILKSVQWEQEATEMHRRALEVAMNASIAHPKSTNSVSLLLKSLDSDQIRMIADTAREQRVFTGNSDHFCDATLFTDLPSDIQRCIMTEQGRSNISPTINSAHESDLTHSYLGLIAADGSVNLGIYTLNQPASQALTMSQTQAVYRNGISGIDEDDGTDSLSDAALYRTRFDVSEPLPDMSKSNHLTFTRADNYTYLPDILTDIHNESGLPVFTELFLASDSCPAIGMLTDRDSYTLRECCEETSRAFGQHMALFGGMLASRSVTPGRDLYMQPDESLCHYLAIWYQKKGSLTLNQLHRLGELTQKQWTYLQTRTAQLITNKHNTYVVLPWRHYLMRLFEMLTPAQLNLAESTAGLRYRLLNPEERLCFLHETEVGLPSSQSTITSKSKSGGLWISCRDTNGYVAHLNFVLRDVSHLPAREEKWDLPGYADTDTN